MVRATADELRHNLSAYLRRVEAGETVLIMRADIPVAELKPIPSTPADLRPIGLAAGDFTVPDDFDAPLPPDILADFEGP